MTMLRWRSFVLGSATAAWLLLISDGFSQTNFDLSISATNSPPIVSLGQYFTTGFTVATTGSDPAQDVVVTNRVPANLQFVSARSTRGTCAYAAGVVTCTIDSIPPYSSVTVTLEFKAVNTGSFTNIAGVVSNPADTPATNNGAASVTSVTLSRFFAAGRMNTNHAYPTCTPLLNGDYLVLGWYLTKQGERYNPATRTFSRTGDLLVPRDLQGAGRLADGRVLVLGGLNLVAYGNGKSAELFDPATGQFSRTVGDLAFARTSPRLTLQPDGRMLICGGAATNEIYNPATGTFSLDTSLACPYDGILLSTGKYLYFGFGRAYLYDPATGSSVETSGFIQPREKQTATLLPDGKVLIAGGRGTWGASYDTLSSAEIYDPTSNTFSHAAPLTMKRMYHSAVLLPDGTVLLAGGRNSENEPIPLATAEIYDPNGALNVPGVGVSDATLVEGDSGTNYLQFNVWLTTPSASPVTVRYATAEGTARSVDWMVANHDFVHTNGTLTIPAGTTNGIVFVPVRGDLVRESDETLALSLSVPTQAWIARATAWGTILDNDPLPSISVSPATSPERDSGFTNLVFNVALSAESLSAISVDYFTANGTALAGADYLASTGTVVFGSGELAKTISVPAIGDLAVEPNETMSLLLTNPVNAVIGAGVATGTIQNDDGIAGAIHHFEVLPVSDPQLQGVGFPATIIARDSFGDIAVNFNGLVRLQGRTTNSIAGNLGFEGTSLAPWVPFNNTPYEKPFQQVLFDVSGLGYASTAFRTVAGGGTNGIMQDIFLTGGITYTFKASFATEMFGDDMSWYGATAYLQIGSTNAAIGLPGGRPGSIGWASGTLVYTPPVSGVYSFQIIIARDYYWGDALAVYIDDVQIACPVIEPSVVTNFVNGVWTGEVRVLQGATNVSLLADDGAGHPGAGNLFDVLAAADLGISGLAYWVPTLRTGGELTFNLAVTNRGPATVADALVQCPMPTNLTFLRSTNKQGLITNNAEGVTWLVGPLPKGTNLSASIVMRADIPGPITNVFTFASASTVELNPSDNSFSLTNQIWPPILTINSTSGTEAFASATGMVFSVTLASPSAQTVTSEYYTVDGSAMAGVDYVATNGVITFPPFTTNAAIRVYAIDDILDEPDRVFSVVLTNFVNAVIGYDTAGAWVYDDDLPPTISIAGTSVVEGDSGTVNAVFPLTMSKPAIADVTVRCTTSPGTAETNDYVHTVTTVSFPVGSTNASFTVPVRGNTVNESNETFTVTLSLSSGATIAVGSATGTIINDDAVPGRLDHFEFGPVASPQFTNRPFQLSVRAVDFRGTNVAFGSTLPLVAQTDEYYTFRMADDFEDGDLAGWTNFGSSTMVVSNVNDVAAAGYRSLRITGKAQNPYASYALRRLFTNSRPTRVSFSVRAAQTNAITGRMWGTAPGPLYLAFDFYLNKDGRMGLYSRNSFVGVPYVSDRWYQVDLDLNWTTRLVNCRVDGALVITNVAFPDDPYSGMSYIAVQNSENGTSWFDNIHVFDAVYTNLLVTPSSLSGFVGGAWTGNVAVARYGSNAYLTVSDSLEHVGRSSPFDMLPINLRWILPAAVTEGDGLVPAQLTMPLSFPQPITVSLTSSLPVKVTVPASVTIAAGETNVAFNLTVLDDALLDGQQTVILSAASTNAVGTSALVLVNDNESAALTLITPATVAETAGTLFNQGRVTSSLPPARNITVMLNSSDPTALQVPSSVVIPAGQTVAIFSPVVMDDAKIDGTQFPTVTATVPGWVNATNVVAVTDNEDTLLRVSGPALVSEGSGSVSYTVRISGTLATNLGLALSSSVPDRLSVPASVSIPSGQTSIVVTATILDDALFNGSALTTLAMQAPGFAFVSTNVTVLDNEVHHLSFAPITGARTSTVPFTVSVSARDIFDGPITARNGPVTLSGLGSGGPILLTTSNIVLSAGQWTGNLALFTAETLVALSALDTNGISGQSAFFSLLPPVVYLANINAADLIGSAASDRLWALVSTNTTLVPIDPWRFLVESSVPAGAGANRLASSGDGRYAHIGRGQFVSRFDTLARAIDLTWSNQSLFIDDFAAVPGNSDSIAVSWMNPGYSPRGAGTQIYDAGVPRIPDGFGAGNAIEFSESPDLLYGYNNETTGFQFNLLQVGETNVVLRKTVGLMGYFGAHFTTVGRWIFATTGGIYDPERGIPVGGASVTPVVGHSTWGRYFKFESTPGRLVTYDLPTLLPISSIVLPGVSNAVGTMVRWGTNGLALRANSVQLAILRSATVPSGPPADLYISSRISGLPALVSNTFSCTLVVSNQGPSAAFGVTLAHNLLTNAVLTAASPSGGTVTQLVNGAVSSFGDLAPGAVASVQLSFMGTLPGLAVIRASATSSSPDPNITNNVIDLPVSVGTQPSPNSITEIRQVTSDLAWNPALGRIFASVPNSEVVMGSTLIDFDPFAGVFNPPIPTGLEPARLAVSANGQYVYAGLYAEAAIQRIDASNRLADLKFPTGFGNAADMAVLPNDPHAVVATVHTMLVVYDNGVPRTNMVGPTEYNHPYYLTVVSPSTCYSTYPTGFRRIAIDAGGATLLSDTRDTVVTYQDWQIEYGAGRLFTPGGRVFDPVAGTNIAVVPYGGLVAPDEASGKVFYLTGSGSSWSLHALNITNLQWAGSVTITNVSGTPTSLIRWGVDGLAFRTTDGQIFLIRTTLADDRDQDGLADTWELTHFGSMTNNATDDPDQDGFTNLQEQQAGFDPLVFDALRFLYGRPALDGGFEMSVIGNPGVTHTLSVSSNLVDWVPLFDFTCADQPTMIVDPSPPPGARYYRLTRGTGN